jgi:phage-related protein
MSDLPYPERMNPYDKPVDWLGGELKTPPMSMEARLKAGFFVRMLQGGDKLSMPESRPMPSIGNRCHELRIQDKDSTWRVIYRLDAAAILIVDVFQKKSQQTPKHVIDKCKARLGDYDTGR